MTTGFFRFAAAVAAAVAVLVPQSAWPGAFAVLPQKVEFDEHTMTSSIVITNRDNDSHLMQLYVYAWNQTGGEDAVNPTDDLVAVPTVFTLPPQGKQTIRIGLRRSVDGSVEQTYRLLIKEVASQVTLATTVRRLALLTSFSLPIYIAPKHADPTHIAWSAKRIGASAIRLTAENEGNVHAKVTAMEIDGPTGVLSRHLAIVNVLARSTRTSKVSLHGRVPASVVLKTTVNDAPSSATIQVGQ